MLQFGAAIVGAAELEHGSAVVLLRPEPEGALAETLTRVQGELVADGFRVTPVPFDGAPSEQALLEVASRYPAVAAVIGLFASPSEASVELWVVEPAQPDAVVTRVQVSASTAARAEAPQLGAEVLARRAVEVLRGTLLRPVLEQQRQAQPKTQAPKALPPRRKPPPAAPLRHSAELGVLALGTLAGASPALLPTVRLRLGIGPILGARIAVSGFGTESHLDAEQGSARVSHYLVRGELISVLTRSRWLRPLVSLGAGAYLARAIGTASAPYVGRSESEWSFAASAGAGASAMLSERISLELELHGLLAAPYPALRFAGEEVARFGRPSWGVVAALAGWL